MNKALSLTNWNKGGKHYVLKATSYTKWVGFQESVIKKLKAKFGDDFFLIIWTDKNKENDFYNIPFNKVKHIFTDDHKTTGNSPDRWTAIISNGSFLMHSNKQLGVDIKVDYGNMHAEYFSRSTDSKNTFQNDEEEQIQLETHFDRHNIEAIKKDLSNLSPFDSAEVEIFGKRYKRNNKTIVQLKILRNFECQICHITIKKKNNKKYIEAAHVKPKSIEGRESPENILILCPNHHKEFDFGERKVLSHEKDGIHFILNGVEYKINLTI